MSWDTHEPLDGMVVELVRRGLPVEYARRATGEIEDHHRDLVDELQAAGMSESQAAIEASRRLGDSRTLIKTTVCEYQRRYWCARWPLITFLLGPIPALLATWIATFVALASFNILLTKLGFLESSESNVRVASTAQLVVAYTIASWFVLAMPALVTYLFARLAKRAALGWQWIGLVACVLGISAGFVRCEYTERPAPDTIVTAGEGVGEPVPAGRFLAGFPLAESWWSVWRWYTTANLLQMCQILLPVSVATVCLLRGRQLALRAERLAIDGC